MLTGLSLSFCIRDVLTGKIPEDKVDAIYCGFDVWTGSPPESYYTIYWKEFERSVIDALVARLQIKLPFSMHRNIAHGHWMIGEPTEERLADTKDRLQIKQAIEKVS